MAEPYSDGWNQRRRWYNSRVETIAEGGRLVIGSVDLESPVVSQERGRIELICGCMFSGKSKALLARMADAVAAGRKVAAFKHACDDRYSQAEIVSHDGERAAAIPVASASLIFPMVGDAEVVVIDEAQFFDVEFPGICRRLADGGRTVIVAGLDRDSWGLPFGTMPQVEQIADAVVRTRARCRCGADADYTQRLGPADAVRMIGGSEAYEPRCARCFRPPPLPLRH